MTRSTGCLPRKARKADRRQVAFSLFYYVGWSASLEGREVARACRNRDRVQAAPARIALARTTLMSVSRQRSRDKLISDNNNMLQNRRSWTWQR